MLFPLSRLEAEERHYSLLRDYKVASYQRICLREQAEGLVRQINNYRAMPAMLCGI
jgi:predicted site-specific integrase-resolvase